MRGHLAFVVDRAFTELWQPLTDYDDCPPGIFGEVYSGLRPHLREPEPEYVKDDDGIVRDVSPRLNDLAAQAAASPSVAEELLVNLTRRDFDSEIAVVRAISSTHGVLCDIATDGLARSYVELLRSFVDRYSLRYYVDSKAQLWVSFSGFMTAIFGQVRITAERDDDLIEAMGAFEHALAECLAEPTVNRIKTAIAKQIIFLEAFGLRHPNVGEGAETLGAILRELRDEATWPHDSLAEVASQLSRFANDYPGIRHASKRSAASRTLDSRDLASVTLSLVGLVVYLTDGFAERVSVAMQGDLLESGPATGAVAPW